MLLPNNQMYRVPKLISIERHCLVGYDLNRWPYYHFIVRYAAALMKSGGCLIVDAICYDRLFVEKLKYKMDDN